MCGTLDICMIRNANFNGFFDIDEKVLCDFLAKLMIYYVIDKQT